MQLVRRFSLLPWSEKFLLFKAWLLVGLIRVSLLVGRFARTKRLLDRLQRRAVRRLVARRRLARRVARMVELASHLIPGGRHCLTRAMALEVLLKRRGYPADVKIGVARDDSGKLIAHAWLHCEGVVLIGGEGAANYVEVSPSSPPSA